MGGTSLFSSSHDPMNRPQKRARSRGSRRRRSSSSNTGVWLAVAVGAALVFVAVLAVFGSPEEDPEPSFDPQPSFDPGATRTDEGPVPKLPRPASRVQATPGKEPEIPPPTFAVEILAQTDTFYEQAVKLDIDARRKQASGDRDEFMRLLREAVAELAKIDAKLDPHALWLEEAELGEWGIPSEYVVLQRRLEKYYKLRGRILRVLPRKR